MSDTPLGLVPLPNTKTTRFYILSVFDLDDDSVIGLNEHLSSIRECGSGEVFASEFVTCDNLEGIPNGREKTREFVKFLAKRMNLADGG